MTPARLLLPLALLSVPVLADEPSPPNPYELFNGAVDSFAASNYTAAADSFTRAAEAAPAQGLSPAQALFDKGVALEATADPAAAAAFLEAARSLNSPLPLQARAYYNAGNLLLRQAIEARSNPETPVLPLPSDNPASPDSPSPSPAPPDPAKLLDASLASLQNAIELDPSNIDAKASYELATLIQQELQQQQQQQPQQNQEQSQDQENQDQNQDPSQGQQPQQDQEQEQQQEQEQDQQQGQEQQGQQQQQSQSPESQEPPQPQSPEDSTQMTPEEATQLLDAMRAREQSQRDQLKPLFGRPIPVENDW